MRERKSGTRLAERYTLVRKLGRGGAAETWLAEDRLTRASVALKLLIDGASSAEALRREWQTSIRLVHAHIARVFEFHDDPDGAFYSLQFIDGPDIGILSGRPCSEILPPIALVADALRYAHARQVVHRDIKPGNVLLDANGAPYLVDFGVASAPGGDTGGGSLIASSPQSLDGEPAARADDIFALGAMIYELVSGRSPWSSADTAADIRNTVPPPLRGADGSEVPEAVRDLVAGMLDKDAAKRPDAAAVHARLCAAGVRPGPALHSNGGRIRALEDEIIESETAPRGRAPGSAAVPESIEGGPRGVRPRTVAISLVLLLLLLLGVVFLLPGTIAPDADEPAAVVDTEIEDTAAPAAAPAVGIPARDERVQAREAAERVLGQLLSKLRTLEGRAVQRWGGLAWKRAGDAYDAGDAAYLARDYDTARQKYAEAIATVDPLLDRVDEVFRDTMAAAGEAIEAAETQDAIRLYELAVAISPSHGPALAGLTRAKNLDTVLTLTEQGRALERELELEAARQSFARAIDIDPEWRPAAEGLERVKESIRQMQFDARMTEGLNALAIEDYPAARAAFRVAQQLKPGSPEPADGLLQVDQGVRLQNIASLERRARSLEAGERWQAAVETYQSILELDANLSFAREGLARSQRMTELHERIEGYIDEPDSLSAPATMQAATQLVVDITRMPDIGPRLAGQRDELSRLLKRAATPLTVELVSDNATEVSIYKVGKLGAFSRTELELRPGTYVAVGSRPGYRDVRLEFRVAPEVEPQPVVVLCEERI